jgi:hypothetical protein
MNIMHSLSILSENEESLQGSYSFLLKTLARKKLFDNEVLAIPPDADTSKYYEREKVKIDEFLDDESDTVDSILLQRTKIEYEARYCTKSSPGKITNSAISFVNREMISQLLDPRANDLKHLEGDESTKKRCYDLLRKTHNEFGLAIYDYELIKRASFAGNAGASSSSASTTAGKKRKKATGRGKLALTTFGTGDFSGSSSTSWFEGSSDDGSEEEDDSAALRQKESLRLDREFKKDYKKFIGCSRNIDWIAEFPGLREMLLHRFNGLRPDESSSDEDDDDMSSESSDDKKKNPTNRKLQEHLTAMDLIYCSPVSLLKAMHDSKVCGLLPLMAMSSAYNIGTVCSGK